MSTHDLFADLLGGATRPAEALPDVSATMPYEMDERGMAELLSLSLSMVRTKAREGVFVRSRPGRYDVEKSVRNYVVRLREMASRTGGRTSADSSDLAAQKLRLTIAQADKEETRVARERKELVSADEVEREWASILRDVRSTMMAVPSRVGATLPHLTAHDVAEIDREIKAALGSLSDGN